MSATCTVKELICEAQYLLSGVWAADVLVAVVAAAADGDEKPTAAVDVVAAAAAA